MPRSIGVVVSDHITLGVVEGDRVSGEARRYPDDHNVSDEIRAMPAADLVSVMADE